LSEADKASLTTLYLAVLSNGALAAYNLNDLDTSLKFSEKALRIDPNHQKCLYRKALCNLAYGDNMKPKPGDTASVKQQLEYYEEAKKGLQAVMKLVPNDKKIEEQLSNLIRLIVKIRKENNLEEQKPTTTKMKVVAEEDSKEEDTTPKANNFKPKKIAPGVSREFLEKVTNNAMNAATSR